MYAQYLFKGKRPTLFGDTTLKPGQPFQATPGDADEIGRYWPIEPLDEKRKRAGRSVPLPEVGATVVEAFTPYEEPVEAPGEDAGGAEAPGTNEDEDDEDGAPLQVTGKDFLREVAKAFTNPDFKEKRAFANRNRGESPYLRSAEDVDAWYKGVLSNGR